MSCSLNQLGNALDINYRPVYPSGRVSCAAKWLVRGNDRYV